MYSSVSAHGPRPCALYRLARATRDHAHALAAPRNARPGRAKAAKREQTMRHTAHAPWALGGRAPPQVTNRRARHRQSPPHRDRDRLGVTHMPAQRRSSASSSEAQRMHLIPLRPPWRRHASTYARPTNPSVAPHKRAHLLLLTLTRLSLSQAILAGCASSDATRTGASGGSAVGTTRGRAASPASGRWQPAHAHKQGHKRSRVQALKRHVICTTCTVGQGVHARSTRCTGRRGQSAPGSPGSGSIG